MDEGEGAQSLQGGRPAAQMLLVGDVPHDWLFPRCADAQHSTTWPHLSAALGQHLPSHPSPQGSAPLSPQPAHALRLALVLLPVAPRSVSGVIHHGGVGTTAAAMLAGRPSFVAPSFGDL
jgi:hypothetical protein